MSRCRLWEVVRVRSVQVPAWSPSHVWSTCQGAFVWGFSCSAAGTVGQVDVPKTETPCPPQLMQAAYLLRSSAKSLINLHASHGISWLLLCTQKSILPCVWPSLLRFLAAHPPSLAFCIAPDVWVSNAIEKKITKKKTNKQTNKKTCTTSVYPEKVGGMLACYTTSEQTVQHTVPSALGNFLKYSHMALLGRLLAVTGLMEVIWEEDTASLLSPPLSPPDAITDFSWVCGNVDFIHVQCSVHMYWNTSILLAHIDTITA